MNRESFQVQPGMLSRRRLFAGTALMAGAYGLHAVVSRWPEGATDHPETPLAGPSLPQFKADAWAVPALAERFPWIHFGENTSRPLQIANAFDPALTLGSRATEGVLGERRFHVGNGRTVVPWAPMFARPTAVIPANPDLRALAGVERLFVKDEGSDSIAIYGNKIRKYEFLLPNLYYGGVRRIHSHGAYGSNHCAHLALAARYADFHAAPENRDLTVALNLYPQDITDDVIIKLRLLAATGVTLTFLEGDAVAGLSIGLLSRMNLTTGRSKDGYVDPGGSSALTVLGHVEAAMELARQIERRSCEMDGPPDFVFLPIGSGGTAMGLALGFYILGWPTRVVATCSQDKGPLTRLVVNSDMRGPFAIAHARRLLAESLVWARDLGLVGDNVTAGDILKRRFSYDNESWRPGYGKMSASVADGARTAKQSGLTLDGTFAAKSFHTLTRYAQSGLLNGKRVLFWNTCQRFPFATLVPKTDGWMKDFPEDVQCRLAQV